MLSTDMLWILQVMRLTNDSSFLALSQHSVALRNVSLPCAVPYSCMALRLQYACEMHSQ